MSTKIEYVDESCNAVLGCTKCSPACENCWASKVVARLESCHAGRYEGYPSIGPWGSVLKVNTNEWNGKTWINLRAFEKCQTKKPKSFLLSSLGDWLHESLSTVQINFLLDQMRQYQQHRFYTLTKRPQRWKELGPIPPNVWLGASVWDQDSYDIATIEFHKLLPNQNPPHFWLSLEPLLDSIDLCLDQEHHWIEWIVVGCESGKTRRPCNIEWIRSIVQQCKEYHRPCFVKQIDLDGKVSKDPLDWPMDLQVQELPK